mgnify:CR=1 FL=1
MFKKNQVIPLTIDSVSNEGNGVGRADGIAVFVPMTAPGDQIRAKIVKTHSSYCYGIVDELLAPSDQRMEQSCPVYNRCGGCSLRHMTYEGELAAKEGWVSDAFRRIGGFSIPIEAIIPSPRQEGYRNKAQYPFAMGPNGAYCGFYAPRSHTVIPAEDCRLQPPFFGELARAVCRYIDASGASVYDERTGQGLFRHLYLRWGEYTGEVMVCLVVNGSQIPQENLLLKNVLEACPQVVSVLLNENTRNTNVILGSKTRVLYGADRIEDVLRQVRVFLSPLSFYQVNHEGAQRLYALAEEMADLKPEDTLLDLYCGTGTIGLFMARRVKEVIGVESVSAAVVDARFNAAANGIENARFLCADAGKAAVQLEEEGLLPTVVILDPPRKGCDETTLEAVARMAPERIVMVSCNPATAARDVKCLADRGYALKRVKPVDMFPRTSHVETVILLSRNEGAIHA